MRTVVALLLGAVLASRAVAGPPLTISPPLGVVPGDPNGGIVTDCWVAARLFRNFSAGTVPYCRGHLRYAPGELDCYQIADQVCSVYLPITREFIETRRPSEPSIFPCPSGPEPPVCPRLTFQ